MRYYRARPKTNTMLVSKFLHRVEISDKEEMKRFRQGYNIKHEVMEWCRENFGQFPFDWGVYTGQPKKIVFYFLTKEDALAFKIRWS